MGSFLASATSASQGSDGATPDGVIKVSYPRKYELAQVQIE